MPYTFQQAKAAFMNNQIRGLSLEPTGLRFLKLRSASRRDQMQRLVAGVGLADPGYRGERLLRYLFESNITEQQIEATIKEIYEEERAGRRDNERELISELYRMESFDWGGLHQNSLEKTIVDNYVKKIRSFDQLNDSIENQLHNSMRSYVQCSWYNHWTSILIEDIFRDHASVLPAVGLIKQIDFFIRGVPFDLKVTYMPEGYLKAKRKAVGLRPELTILRQFCRTNDIHFSNDLPDGRLLEDLWKKVNDHPSEEATMLTEGLLRFRAEIVRGCLADPVELIRWLYENQGVRRFDASNRLFLILIDQIDYFSSWKLKRAKALLVERIHNHLDAAGDGTGRDVIFEWEGEQYRSTSDAIFVVRNNG